MSVDTSVSPKQIKKLIKSTLEDKLVPYISGSPGLGKSDIIRQIASEYNLKIIDIRLTQYDPSELLGFPGITNGRSTFNPPADFPLEGDSIPDGYAGWLIFFDEISSAVPQTQSAAYQIILDRTVGQHKLHKNVAIVAAGNLMTDKAVVHLMSSALRTRFTHFRLKPSVTDWIEWADNNNIDFRIKAFIGFRPDLLFHFDPNNNDDTFPTPRTWEFANRALAKVDVIDEDTLTILCGRIGIGAAYEFKSFVREYDKLPSIGTMVSNPDSVVIPTEPSTLYAIASYMAHYVTEDNLDALIQVIHRLPKEFQVISLQSVIRGNREFLKHKAITEWVKTNASELF